MSGRQSDSSGAGALNLSALHLLDSATPEEPPVGVTLKDFIINCPSEDSTNPVLDGMEIIVLGLGEGISGRLERTTQTSWKFHQVIQLHKHIDELVLFVQLEGAGALAYVAFSKGELGAFMVIDQNTQLQCNFMAVEPNSPLLRLTFTVEQQPNATLGFWNTSDIMQNIKPKLDAIQNLEIFSSMLSRFLQDPRLVNGIGDLFYKQFLETNSKDDINKAVLAYEVAIELITPDDTNYGIYVQDAGLALSRRFELFGKFPDINKAILMMEVAIAYSTEKDVDYIAQLNDLATLLISCFEYTGELKNIESAISSLQSAIKLTSEGNAIMPTLVNNLATSFVKRFQHNRDLTDLESAISSLQKVVMLTPEGHENLPLRLKNLGVCFVRHYEHTSDFSDIENAIFFQQRAIKLISEEHADMPFQLNNLGTSFVRRFEHTGDSSDIESAIFYQQRAVKLTPDGHTVMPSHLQNLGNLFATHFGYTGDLADIESAISSHQKAVMLIPEGRADMPFHLSNLGNCFLKCFEHTHDVADIESAISYQKQSVKLTPEGHADMCSHLNNLGNVLYRYYNYTKDSIGIDQVISIYSQSATYISGRPSHRLYAAQKWATLAHQFDMSTTLQAFGIAIGLLSQIAGLEQTIHKRHSNLIEISDLVTFATATAIEQNKINTALEWLEQGRCLVWNQLDQLRTPVDDLHAHDPLLASQFSQIAHDLDTSGSRPIQGTFFSEANMDQMIANQDRNQAHVHFAQEWKNLLLKINQIPGFENFLQPPNASDLLAHTPPDGPIIIFNFHKERCDAIALIFGVDSPLHIPLETFSLQHAIQLQDDLQKYLNYNYACQRSGDRATFWLHVKNPEGLTMYKILHEIWEHVAKPILDGLGYSFQHPKKSRIWWCPTGPLTFLPIHAAGIYSKEKMVAPGSCISDYVVSSYTPTVTTLLNKIKGSLITKKNPISMLLISQPSTPGQTSLPGAREESHAIQIKMEAAAVRSLLLEDASANIVQVKAEMNSHSWVHFACHAIQDIKEPLESGVQLHDNRLELLEMMKQQLPNADFAFLSACQTSTGDEKLSEEAVHLAAGMLAAGYQSVVATMWSIKDKYGPVVAKDFYAYMVDENLENRQLDSANAAYALHYAIQKIRKELGDTEEALLTWVPYVHFGI